MSVDPYKALDRVLKMHPHVRRNLLRLEVRCEGRHTPVRVYRLREGLLVHCRSDADVRALQKKSPHLPDWSPRRAFFLEDWLSQPDDVRPGAHLQVVCDCAQTRPRLVNVQRLVELVPADGAPTRRVAMLEVLAPEA